jgi:hypothetical protein
MRLGDVPGLFDEQLERSRVRKSTRSHDNLNDLNMFCSSSLLKTIEVSNVACSSRDLRIMSAMRGVSGQLNLAVPALIGPGCIAFPPLQGWEEVSGPSRKARASTGRWECRMPNTTSV